MGAVAASRRLSWVRSCAFP